MHADDTHERERRIFHSSFRALRGKGWSEVAVLVEVGAIVAVMSCAGLQRHLLKEHYALLAWGPFALLLAFALAWAIALVQHRFRSRA